MIPKLLSCFYFQSKNSITRLVSSLSLIRGTDKVADIMVVQKIAWVHIQLFLLGGSSKDGQIDRYLKNHYILSNKIAMNKDKNTHKKQVYNQQEINWLQGGRRKGA